MKKFKSKPYSYYSDLRFYWRHFSEFHDTNSKLNPPHESINDIVENNAHQFYYKKSFLFCSSRNKYYNRLFL